MDMIFDFRFIFVALFIFSLPLVGLAQEEDDRFRCDSEPWGKIDYFYCFLEPNRDVLDLVPMPSVRTIWHFQDKSGDDLREFLAMAGLGQAEIFNLIKSSEFDEGRKSWRVFPSRTIVESLSAETRGAIYRELRLNSHNDLYRNPVLIESGNVRDWFEGFDFSDDFFGKVDSLTYLVGDLLAFSDLPVLLSYAKSEKEQSLIRRAVFRTRTMILTPGLPRDSAAANFKDYWTVQGRYTASVPFIDSILENEEAAGVNILHLLPPIARKHLYSYPGRDLAVDGVYPDSFWISFNFFNDHYDDFNDPKLIKECINSNFKAISKNYRFGDILIAVDPSAEENRGSCVFIADDIVYTKYGRSILTPFVFTKMRDWKRRLNFAIETPLLIDGWREVDP